MRTNERLQGLIKAPSLFWNTLVKGSYQFVYDQMPITLSKMSIRKRINLITSGMNLVHRRLTPWSMPLHMQFELTNYCNLKCPVCPTGIRAVKRKKQAMSVSLFKHIIDQVGPHLLTASLWAWGESLLHPSLGKILEAACKHKFAIFLSTNGQNLNDEKIIQALIQHPPMFLIVALDGLDDESNSKFRIGAKLKPALEGVKRLAHLKKQMRQSLPILHMRFIVMKHNEHQVPHLEEFARDHDFDFLSVRTLSIIDTEKPDIIHSNFIPDTDAMRAYHYNNNQRIIKNDFYCLEPFWFPTVFADGTLVACEQDYNAKMPLGKLSAETMFHQLWFDDRARSIRKKIRDCSSEVSFCRHCPYRDRDTTDVSISYHCIHPFIDSTLI